MADSPNSTKANLLLGRRPATITCFFSDRTAYSGHRPFHSDVRAYLAVRVNRRVMATNYRVVGPYQSMEQQP